MPDQRYDAARQTLGTLLSVTSPKLEVPDWQRSYAWRDEQLEAFWQDLIAFDRQYPESNIENQEYFLGSAVIVTGGGTNLVLDGQQRLATATILLSVLRDARATFQADAAVRLQNKYIADFDDERQETTPVLRLNLYDRDFFRREIQESAGGGDRPTASLKSHTLIRKAREFFKQKLDDEYAQLESERSKFDRNLRLGNVVCNHLSLVVVTSTDEDNAAAVFETLNDRGIGLSTPDLLRNFLMRRAGNEASRQLIVGAWQLVLGIADEANVDDFLRHFWVSRHGDVKSRKLYREIKDTLVADETDVASFSTQLADSAGTYRDIVWASSADPDLRRSLEAAKALGAKVLYPGLLSALEIQDADPLALRQYAQDLVTTFVRYNVIGGRETTTMEEAIYRSASELRGSGDFVAATGALRALSPAADEFVARFARASVSRIATARYLLTRIEEEKRATGEVSVQRPDRVHVEHIYPQTPLATERSTRHAQIVNRLGNLTLLARSLNTSIKNAAFDVKKTSGYASSQLLLTQELMHYEVWDEGSIERRQLELSEWAFAAWHFAGEDPPGASIAVETQRGESEELPEVPS